MKNLKTRFGALSQEWVLMNYDISKRIDAVISALEDKYIHNDSVAGKELTDIPGVFKIVKDSDV